MADVLTLNQVDQKVENLGLLFAQEFNQVRNLVLADTAAMAAYTGSRTRILLQDNRPFVLDRNASGTPNGITDVAALGGGWWRLESIPVVTAALLGTNATATLQSVINNMLATSVDISGVINGIGVLNPKGKTIYLRPNSKLVARPLTTQERSGNALHYGMLDMQDGGRIIGTGIIDGNNSFRTGENMHGVYWDNSTAAVTIQGPTLTGFSGDAIRFQNATGPRIKDVDIVGNSGRGVHIIETNEADLDSVRIDGALHGIQWWSGSSRYCESLSIRNCQVKNVQGSGVWGFRGLGVVVSGGHAINCGDYCYGFEACFSSSATSVFAKNGLNAGLAFYNGCQNVTYSDCHVVQGVGMGPGIKSFSPNRPAEEGVGKNRNIVMTGGSITCADSMTPVNTDQDCTEDFRLIDVSLRGAYVQFLDTNHVKMTDCTVYTSSAYGIRHLGGNYGIFKNNRLFYTGPAVNTANEICIIYRSEKYQGAYNIVEGNQAYGFGGGCFDDDQNGPLSSSGNKFIGNLTGAPVKQNKANYSLICKGNYKLDGSSVDGWERQFTGIVTGQNQQGYVPILTLPATGENTYDHAVVVVSLGGFAGSQKKVLTLSVGQRDVLSVNTICQGDNDTVPGSVVAYKKANGQTVFYLKLGTYAEASISYTALQLAQGVDRLQLSADVPVGQKVYDSADTKPNLEIGSIGLKSFGVPLQGGAAGGLDSVATFADLTNKAVSKPTLFSVDNDEQTGRKDVVYLKSTHVQRQLVDSEYVDGQA